MRGRFILIVLLLYLGYPRSFWYLFLNIIANAFADNKNTSKTIIPDAAKS